MERDETLYDETDWEEDFNSHAHVERDSGTGKRTERNKNFNSHAHVERDAEAASGVAPIIIFQLTRSRGA